MILILNSQHVFVCLLGKNNRPAFLISLDDILSASVLPGLVRSQALYGAGTQTLNPLESDISPQSSQRFLNYNFQRNISFSAPIYRILEKRVFSVLTAITVRQSLDTSGVFQRTTTWRSIPFLVSKISQDDNNLPDTQFLSM